MKKYIVCLLAIVCLGFLTVEADALSVQARGMVGAMPLAQADSFSANGLGLDVFVYEGGNLDIFLGVEQDSFSVTSSNITSSKSWPGKKIAFSAKATAFDIGFRFKPTTSWRIKPYFPLELLYFQDISFNNVKLESTEAGVTYTLLSYSQPAKIGGRVGVGTDIGISDRLTLGVQFYANILPTIAYKYHRTDAFSSVDYENSGLPTGVLGINLGLRYSF